MGGMVVQTAILRAPERFDGLVLMDTSHRALRRRPRLVELGVAIARAEGIAAVLAAQDALGAEQPLGTGPHQRLLDTRPGYAEFGDRKMLASSPAMYARDAPGDHRRRGGLDRLADLRARRACPTLVLVGEEDAPVPEAVAAHGRGDPGRRARRCSPTPATPRSSRAPTLWWAALTGFLGARLSGALARLVEEALGLDDRPG